MPYPASRPRRYVRHVDCQTAGERHPYRRKGEFAQKVILLPFSHFCCCTATNLLAQTIQTAVGT